MKPCFSKRKLLAWLALGELDARREQDLRAHLETCGACRHYLAEISAVGERLAAADARSEVEACESFHRRLVNRVKAPHSRPAWTTMAAWLPPMPLTWRVALPAMGAVAVIISILAILPRQSAPSAPVQVARPVVAPPDRLASLAPTIANYQRAATRSLDELDDLLSRQADRNPPPAPIYTASILALVTGPD